MLSNQIEKMDKLHVVLVYLEVVDGEERWYVNLYWRTRQGRGDLIDSWPENDLGHKGKLSLSDQYNIEEWLLKQGVNADFCKVVWEAEDELMEWAKPHVSQ